MICYPVYPVDCKPLYMNLRYKVKKDAWKFHFRIVIIVASAFILTEKLCHMSICMVGE